MVEKEWFRVVDPLSPLYGCDVKTAGGVAIYDPIDFVTRRFEMVIALRRVDVFVGDRPFQLVAKEGENLGLMIDETQLEESPLQDETVETGTDRPHGLCIDESEMTRGDGVKLRIARYERATQMAVEDPKEGLLATATDTSEYRDITEKGIVGMFEAGVAVDEIAYALGKN